jgi:hypothetical protein
MHEYALTEPEVPSVRTIPDGGVCRPYRHFWRFFGNLVLARLRRIAFCSDLGGSRSQCLSRGAGELAVQDFLGPQAQALGHAASIVWIGLEELPNLALLNLA